MNGTTDNAAATPASLGADLLDCWRQLPNKGFFFMLLAAWLLLFQFLGNGTYGYIDTSSLFRWMYNAYTNGDGADGHGPWVPVVVVALFCWKRKELLALPLRVWTPGLLLLALALLLHLAGYLVQQQRVSIVALFLGIYALMGMAWGPRWLRTGFFPFFLFAFCVPVTSIAEPVTFRLRLLVSTIVANLSQLLLLDVQRTGTNLFNSTHTYGYDVAAACSGLHSVVAILCIATIYAFMNFDKNWKRALIMASAFPLSVAGNVIRLMCIVVAAEFGGKPAGDFVHENWFFSLLPYIPAILGVMLLGHWLRARPAETILPLNVKTA